MCHGIVLVLPNVIVLLALVAEIVSMPAGMIAANANADADADVGAAAAAADVAYGVRVRMVIVGIVGVVNWCGMQIGVVSTARRGARADRGGAAVQYANRRFTCIGI